MLKTNDYRIFCSTNVTNNNRNRDHDNDRIYKLRNDFQINCNCYEKWLFEKPPYKQYR